MKTQRASTIGLALLTLAAWATQVGCPPPPPPPPPPGPPPQCGLELGDCRPGYICNGERQCVADPTYVEPQVRAREWLERGLEELNRLAELEERRRAGEDVRSRQETEQGVIFLDPEPPDCALIEESYSQAARLVLEVPNSRFNLALCKVQGDDFAGAEAMLREELAARPENEAALMLLARLMVRDNRVQDAADMLGAYVEGHRRATDVRANYAALLYRLGRVDDSIEQCREILIVDPAHAGAYATMALAHLERNNPLLAMFVIRTGLEAQRNNQRPADPNLLVNQGVLFLRQNNLLAALANFRRAVMLAPEHVAANMNLGNIALRYADYEQSIRSFNIVLRWEPGNEDARIGLADALAGTNDPENVTRARQMYEDILRQRPTDQRMLWNYAVLVFLRQRNADEGHAALRRFLGANPANQELRGKAEGWLLVSPDEVIPREEEHSFEAAGPMCPDPDCPPDMDPEQCLIPCPAQLCPDMTCEEGASAEDCPDIPCEEGYCPVPTCAAGQRCEPTLCPGRYLCPMPDCPPGETCPDVLCPAGMCPADNCAGGQYCEPVRCPPERLPPPEGTLVVPGAGDADPGAGPAPELPPADLPDLPDLPDAPPAPPAVPDEPAPPTESAPDADGPVETE